MKVFVSLKFGSFQNMDLLDTPNPYPPTQCLKFVVIAFSNEVTETFFFFFLGLKSVFDNLYILLN